MASPSIDSNREVIDRPRVAELQAAGALGVDDRRRRPLYFDGRFLAARDLSAEQAYFLLRQADLGTAMGGGVVQGLSPTWVSSTSVRVEAGLGFTPSGEPLALSSPLTIDLGDAPEEQTLDVAFGLAATPSEPARSRSGLYVLALRPVEYTANPIPSYPTTPGGPRSTVDGDIVEAVAATLVPYNGGGNDADWGRRRARAAWEIFVQGTPAAALAPAGALPVAMVALDRGVVQWVDPDLVRRDAGGEREDTLGLGFVPRALRAAFYRQHARHLQDVLKTRTASTLTRFAAADAFLALPPVGRLPSTTIDPAGGVQSYFPPGIDVGLSVVADDELPVLVEESLRLPPIDLTLAADALDSTSVLVLVPVPRAKLKTLGDTLTSIPTTLAPSAPGLIARRRPIDALRLLTMPKLTLPSPSPPPPAGELAWNTVIGGSPILLWYVRRRNLAVKPAIAGTGTTVTNPT